MAARSVGYFLDACKHRCQLNLANHGLLVLLSDKLVQYHEGRGVVCFCFLALISFTASHTTTTRNAMPSQCVPAAHTVLIPCLKEN